MSFTLAQMRDKVELMLDDSGNAYWATADIDQAIRHAFFIVAELFPRRLVGTISDVDGQYEYDLTTLTNWKEVIQIHWPYDSSDPQQPPNVADWQFIDQDTIVLTTTTEPDGTDKLRVFYTARHTLNGLDSDSASTMSEILEEIVIQGALAFCCSQRAIDATGEINTDVRTPDQWLALSNWHYARFVEMAGVKLPDFSRAFSDRGWQLDKWDSGVRPTDY